MTVDDYEFTFDKAVESAEAKTTAIVVYPLELVPAVTLTVEPAQVMVPAKRAEAPARSAGARALPRDKTGDGVNRAGRAAGLERNADRGAEFFRRGRSADPLHGEASGENCSGCVRAPSLREARRRNVSHVGRADSHAADAQLERNPRT